MVEQNFPQPIAKDEKGYYYNIEKILDRKQYFRGYKYLIKWAGWPPEYNTWEPISNLQSIIEIVRDFDRSLEDNTIERQIYKKEEEIQQIQAKIQKDNEVLQNYLVNAKQTEQFDTGRIQQIQREIFELRSSSKDDATK